MLRSALFILCVSALAGAVDCDPRVAASPGCGKLAGEVAVLAPGADSIEQKDVALKVARKLRNSKGCSTRFLPMWKRVLSGVPKSGLSDAEKKEVRGCLVAFLRKSLDTPVTLPEVTGTLELAQTAVDAKLVDSGDKLQSLHARGMALREEIEKSQPQMSTEAGKIAESEKCTIGGPLADEQKKCDPLRKDLLAWLKTVK